MWADTTTSPIRKRWATIVSKTSVGGGRFLRLIRVCKIVASDGKEISYPNGITPKLGQPYAFVKDGMENHTYNHESAHTLNLTTKANSKGEYHEESDAVGPGGKWPLMRSQASNLLTTKWLRQEDWRTSNRAVSNGLFGP